MEDSQSVNLLLQSAEGNTTAEICPYPPIKDKSDSNHVPLSTLIPPAMNCRIMKIPHSTGLLLSNMSLLHDIEINSDKPVSVLSGVETNYSAKDDNERRSEQTANQITTITWSITSPSGSWTNQFLLIHPPDKSRAKLAVLCKYV